MSHHLAVRRNREVLPAGHLILLRWPTVATVKRGLFWVAVVALAALCIGWSAMAAQVVVPPPPDVSDWPPVTDDHWKIVGDPYHVHPEIPDEDSTVSAVTPSQLPRPAPSGTALSETTCPGARDSAVRACLTRAAAQQGRLAIAFTVNVELSPIQDSAHRHLHLFLANPGAHGGTIPDASVMQLMAPHPGSWFNVYSPDVAVIDASTERGGRGLPLDLRTFSLLCVRVATGAHSLVPTPAGGFRTGNCVEITPK